MITVLLGTTTAKYSQTFNDVVQHGLCWWFSSFSLFAFLVEVVGYIIIKELHLRLLYFEYIFSLYDQFSHAGVLLASRDPLHCAPWDVDIESSRPGRSCYGGDRHASALHFEIENMCPSCLLRAKRM